jgi:hypothetical protein
MFLFSSRLTGVEENRKKINEKIEDENGISFIYPKDYFGTRKTERFE